MKQSVEQIRLITFPSHASLLGFQCLKDSPLNSEIEPRSIEVLSQTPPGKQRDQAKICLLNLLQ